MSQDVRLPGESYEDFCRRTWKDPQIPVDNVYRATKGPRFAGESSEAYTRRLVAADGWMSADEQYQRGLRASSQSQHADDDPEADDL